MPITFVPVTVSDAATYTVKAANSGLMHYLPDFASSCTITLPTPAAGLWFEFVSKAVAADAQNWVFTSGSATYFALGGVIHLDSDAGAATDELVLVVPNGTTNGKLTVTTPQPGTRLRIESANGTNWIFSGLVMSATAPAFADV